MNIHTARPGPLFMNTPLVNKRPGAIHCLYPGSVAIVGPPGEGTPKAMLGI